MRKPNRIEINHKRFRIVILQSILYLHKCYLYIHIKRMVLMTERDYAAKIISCAVILYFGMYVNNEWY